MDIQPEIQAHPEIRVQLSVLYTNIAHSIEDGDYQQTYAIFSAAEHAYNAYHNGNGPKPARGSVQSNMIEHTFADIVSATAEAMHYRVSARRSISTSGYEGPRLLTREVGAGDLTFALMVAQDSLAYPGISDINRFFGHYCRATAFLNLGDFMAELHTIIPESEHAALLANIPHECRDALWCYKNAAWDAFYAAHVAGTAGMEVLPQVLVDNVHDLHSGMCAKIGYDAAWHVTQMLRVGLAERQLPGLGLWEGDPALAEYWGDREMDLMARYRQRDDYYELNAEELEEESAEPES